MADKKITITLSWGVHQYKVQAITNTTVYKPGKWLEVAEVEKLCTLPNWEVSIIDDQILMQLLGMAVTKLPTLPIPKL